MKNEANTKNFLMKCYTSLIQNSPSNRFSRFKFNLKKDDFLKFHHDRGNNFVCHQRIRSMRILKSQKNFYRKYLDTLKLLKSIFIKDSNSYFLKRNPILSNYNTNSNKKKEVEKQGKSIIQNKNIKYKSLIEKKRQLKLRVLKQSDHNIIETKMNKLSHKFSIQNLKIQGCIYSIKPQFPVFNENNKILFLKKDLNVLTPKMHLKDEGISSFDRRIAYFQSRNSKLLSGLLHSKSQYFSNHWEKKKLTK